MTAPFPPEYGAPRRVLVTGGAGFIGSNLVRHLLENRGDWEVVTLDLLTYAGSLDNLVGVLDDPRHYFVQGDVCDRDLVRSVISGERGDVPGPVDLVLNLAAESHVDRSIAADEPFVRTNVLGTQVLLSECRGAGVPRFVQMSTDEVYGDLPWRDPLLPPEPEVEGHSPPGAGLPPGRPGRTSGGAGHPAGAPPWRYGADGVHPAEDAFREDAPLAPRSPYAAAKAAADLLTLSYHATFGPAERDGGMDVVICRSSNIYGPRQHGEKLIPTLIRSARAGRDLPLYGDGLHIRDWLHVSDCCRGLTGVAERGRPGQVYNLGGAAERTNRQVARAVLGAMETHCAPRISSVLDRKGHDRRYSMDFSCALEELGWRPSVAPEDGIADTVSWYQAHPGWLSEGEDAR